MKDYNQFIEISLGSAYELETHLLICQSAKLGNVELIGETIAFITEEEKILLAFSRTLQS